MGWTAKFVKILGPVLYLIHNENTVATCYNRVRKTVPTLDATHEDLDDDPYDSKSLDQKSIKPSDENLLDENLSKAKSVQIEPHQDGHNEQYKSQNTEAEK